MPRVVRMMAHVETDLRARRSPTSTSTAPPHSAATSTGSEPSPMNHPTKSREGSLHSQTHRVPAGTPDE